MQVTTMVQRKTPDRTIHLTDRPPIMIVDADWPVVARVRWHNTQNEKLSTERAWIRVRHGKDGRAIVYGLREGLGRELLVGFLVSAGDRSQFVDAVKKACSLVGLDEQALFDDMPPEFV